MTTSDTNGGRYSFVTTDATQDVEFSDVGTDTTPTGPALVTAESLLEFMRSRVRYYGSPLPEGFVAPPGIDVDALLKRVPWPEPTN